MADITREQIIEAIKSMNVLELSELVKELEEIFGVSAAAPVAIAAAAPAAGAPEAAAEEAAEQTEFDVVLTAVGDQKIKVIKVVHEQTGLGLKDAKAIVDGAPSKVKQGLSKEDAEELKAKLTEVGATVEIK